MIKILIKGTAYTNYEYPEKLDGIDCPDVFSDYFDEDNEFFKRGVTGGHTDFHFYDDKLWVHTTYQADELLNEEELKALYDYTSGQWSDGIGEGFEQEPCYYNGDDEVYISMWHRNQIVTVEQSEKN